MIDLYQNYGGKKMSMIEHDLLPKQRSRSNGLSVKVDLYDHTTELYNELLSLGMIQRLKEIPQLGVIKVPTKLKKSRYDYTILQLYFHQLVKKEVQSSLELTYNNAVLEDEFRDTFSYSSVKTKPTIGDLLQILTIAYNLGHFYNTFVASRAIVMLSSNDSSFKSKLISGSNEPSFQKIATGILEEENYNRLHLLNSILLLDRCNQNLQSVILAKELLYCYLDERELSPESKLHYVFRIFRSVRNVSYMAYDLQIANTPITIDLANKQAICMLFRELLSKYNDKLPANQLVESIGKMLDDTVYNEKSNAICYYRLSRKMVSKIKGIEGFDKKDYFSDFWLSRESILNAKFRETRDYSTNSILKLTFKISEKDIARSFLSDLEKIQNSRVGYYDRRSGDRTIVVSIKKTCKQKKEIAFRILRTVIMYLRQIKAVSANDSRYLLSTKFFLHYLFGESPIVLKETIDPNTCVICTRGRKSRIIHLKKMMNMGFGTTDQRHEIDYMTQILSEDIINDTSITVPGSILVFKKTNPSIMLCEFDGLIIHPMRKSNQIILMEAKNTTSVPAYAKKCLSDKLDKLNFQFNENSIEILGYDASLTVTI
jgi:hypothetical protein